MYRKIRSNQVWGLMLVFVSLLLLFACQSDPTPSETEAESPLVPLIDEFEEPENQWGFINTNGEIVINANYDEVNNFADGLAAYREKAAWGYINNGGEKVIKAAFYNAFDFSDGLAKVCDFDRRYGIINKKGEQIIPCAYQDLRSFFEELCAVRLNEKWGYINAQNMMQIETQFEAAKDFTNGLAIVKKNNKFFLINKKGKAVSDSFEKISLLKNGLYKIRDAKLFGIMDKFGKIVVQPMYTIISQTDSEVFAVKKDGRYFLRSLDRDSFDVPTNNGINYVSANRWSYEQNGKIGLIDNQGKIVMSPKYNIITEV